MKLYAMSRKTVQTRRRILDCAVALLEGGSGSTVRMSDIAKAAGVSRQAVYLHFPNRAELLIAATRHLDEINDIDKLLEPSRSAARGRERLDEWVNVWGNYIPRIYGVAKALLAMKDSDAEARAAWDDRMLAVKDGCAAAVRALKADGDLAANLGEDEATDLLWTLLSVRTWELLTAECGWPQDRYLAHMQRAAFRLLVDGASQTR